MADTHRRTLVKAVSWRLTGTVDTVIVSWIITGEIGAAFSIGLITTCIKIFTYYMHERVWNRVQWGKRTKYEG